MTRKLVFLLISPCFAAALFGSVVYAERLPVRLYTSADGLGSSFIDCILRDSRGFMWFCTRDGLSRFDGAQIITYRVGDKDSPPGIENIAETSGGVYWITTTGGLFRFQARNLSRPRGNRERPTLNAEYVHGRRGLVIEDRAGNLFYQEDDLFRLHERNGKIELEKINLYLPTTNQAPFKIFNIQEAADGSFWMNTNRGVVRRLPDDKVVFYEHPKDVGIEDAPVLTDDRGYVWVGEGSDIYIIKPPNLESLKHFPQLSQQPLKATYTLSIGPQSQINLPVNEGEVLRLTQPSSTGSIGSALKTDDGHIWLLSADKLMEYDGQIFHTYGTAQGLLKEMRELGEDSAGNLWIGGQSGLLYLNRRGLTTYRESDGLKSPRVFTIGEAADGAVWVANGDFYLSKFNGQRFDTTRPRIPSNASPIWFSRYAFLSSANEWWILTVKGLYRFAATNLGKPLAIYDRRNGLNADEGFQIFEDSKGDIWLSLKPLNVEDSSLLRLKRGEDHFYRFSSAENYPAGRVASSFSEDKNGNLWISFYYGGIGRFANNHFELFTDGLPEGFITDLHVDSRSRLWVATALSGIKRADNLTSEKLKFTSLTTNEGLSSNNVRTITEDKAGNIYVGTVRGVDRISAETNRLTNFSVNDGLAGDFVVDSICDRNGTVWFGTTNGLSRLTPSVEARYSAPTILLGRLRIAGEDQPVSELGATFIQTADLSPSRNSLQVDFFGLDFGPGRPLKYQLMLEGADSEWSEPTEARTVAYANLKPGSYRFLVRALTVDGLVSERPASIAFRILPPIWLRWWFMIIAALVTLGLFYAFYRYRMAHLKQVNTALAEAKRAEEDLGRAREERLLELARVRTRIATDLHDDIGASLTQIAILSEVARQQSMQGKSSSLDPLNSIVNVSNELVETMSDIVWAINPEKDNLQNLVQRMRRFTSDLLTAKQIAFNLDVPTYAPEVPLGANARREVFLIFKECLTNAVKHSQATHVEIRFEFSSDLLTLSVTDNGKGFDVTAVSNTVNFAGRGGHGLLSMKKRAVEMGGSFQVESTPGEGTAMTFRLPLAATGPYAHGLTTHSDGDTGGKLP